MSKKARYQKCTVAPLPRGPVRPVRTLGLLRSDPESLRRDLARPVHGVAFQRRTPVRPVRGPEISRRDSAPPVRALKFLRHAPEFLPLDPERQRKERRCAL